MEWRQEAGRQDVQSGSGHMDKKDTDKRPPVPLLSAEAALVAAAAPRTLCSSRAEVQCQPAEEVVERPLPATWRLMPVSPAPSGTIVAFVNDCAKQAARGAASSQLGRERRQRCRGESCIQIVDVESCERLCYSMTAQQWQWYPPNLQQSYINLPPAPLPLDGLWLLRSQSSVQLSSTLEAAA